MLDIIIFSVSIGFVIGFTKIAQSCTCKDYVHNSSPCNTPFNSPITPKRTLKNGRRNKHVVKDKS